MNSFVLCHPPRESIDRCGRADGGSPRQWVTVLAGRMLRFTHASSTRSLSALRDALAGIDSRNFDLLITVMCYVSGGWDAMGRR